ncbi:tetratricopeptide repeat protein 5-like isoform X2 [Amblyomma americanum]
MADDQAESSKQRNENNGDSFCLKSLKEAVDELYTFRDNYYVKNPNASQKQRTEDVEEKLTKVLNELDAHGGVLEKTDRATFQMLKGKALNIREDYDPEAHEALSKAVKFNPKLAEAWNELGECYWKKGHITKARNCFEGVLKVTKDKVSLRNLSMVLRQVGETEEERLHNVLESVTKAKEALQLDIADGKSWSILGNAYLTVYFSGAQNVKSLQQALAAYARALEDPRMLCCSDLFHNRAVGHLKPRKLKALLSNLKAQPVAGLVPAKLQDLSPGKNSNCVLSVKVACSVLSQERFPFTMCVLDEAAACLAVNVYNMAEGRGFVTGDFVVIPRPNLHHIKVNHQGCELSFPSIRVDTPLDLIVNGKALSSESRAPLRLEVEIKKD